MVVVVAIQNLFPIMAQSAHGHTTGRPRLRLRKIEIMEPAVEAPFKRIENALASVAVSQASVAMSQAAVGKRMDRLERMMAR